eukprot:351094_1
MSVEVEHLPEFLEITYLTVYGISAVILIVLFIIHHKNLFQDLCTAERKCIEHRRNKPKITKNYKIMAACTSICVSSLMIATIMQTVMQSDVSGEECLTILMAMAWPWTLGKGFMYITLLLRLDHVYSQSAYGYSKKTIYILLIINIIIILFLPITILATPDETQVLDDNDAFPNYCFTIPFLIVPVVTLLWDFTMNILCLILFLIPLRKTIKGTQTHNNNVNKKVEDKMIYVGAKYTILTAVAAFTTLLVILLAVLTPNLAFLVGTDGIFNAIAIMLMTPYYPDDIYYERLCCLCLKCSPVEYRSKASKRPTLESSTVDPDSHDTMSVIAYQAEDAAPNSPASGLAKSLAVKPPTDD